MYEAGMANITLEASGAGAGGRVQPTSVPEATAVEVLRKSLRTRVISARFSPVSHKGLCSQGGTARRHRLSFCLRRGENFILPPLGIVTHDSKGSNSACGRARIHLNSPRKRGMTPLRSPNCGRERSAGSLRIAATKQ